jgi:prepilin-type N-terminal cleavage/methylation domain-containing protein
MTILENYLKSKKVQKTLSTKPGEEGFSLIELVVVIAVLAILSAVAIPAFNGVQANARASAAKNGLVNIIKECIVLATDTDDDNDNLDNSATFQGDFRGYTLEPLATLGLDTDEDGSCYGVQATPDNGATESFFSIQMLPNGQSVKECTNPGGDIAPGCNASETW